MHHLKGTCECYGGRKRPTRRRPTARGGGYFAKLQKVAGPFIRQPYLMIDGSRRPPYAVQLCMEASTDRHIRARCSLNGGITAHQTKKKWTPSRYGRSRQDITAAMHIDHRDSVSHIGVLSVYHCVRICILVAFIHPVKVKFKFPRRPSKRGDVLTPHLQFCR